MPWRAFSVFGHTTASLEEAVRKSVLMPWRAFSVFGHLRGVNLDEAYLPVLMPWRAFSVFGRKALLACEPRPEES